jgi:hypothetical protein
MQRNGAVDGRGGSRSGSWYDAAVRRRLFTVCSAVSLLVCVAVCALWAVSYWQLVQVSRTTVAPPRSSAVYVVSGGVQVYDLSGSDLDAAPGTAFVTYPVSRVAAVGAGRALWFFDASSGDKTHIGIPCWSVAAPLTILPASWAVAWRRARRGRAAGMCPLCGYDLRATPARCPECGAAGTMPAPIG